MYRTAIPSGFVAGERNITRVPANLRIGVMEGTTSNIIADSTTVSSGSVACEFNISGIICNGYVLGSANSTAQTIGSCIVVELNGSIAGQRDRGGGVNSTT